MSNRTSHHKNPKCCFQDRSSKGSHKSLFGSGLLFFFLLPFLPLLTSCFKSNTETPASNSSPSAQSIASPKIGQPIYSFDFKSVQWMAIAKNDPFTGDQWVTELVKGEGDFSGGSRWRIQTFPSGAGAENHLDRLANESFISHLLDTLTSLRVTARASTGSASEVSLEDYRLDPPFYALRWKTPDGEIQTLEIGEPVSSQDIAKGSYARIQGSSKNKPSHEIWIVNGSLLQMLRYLKSFSLLRHRKFTGLSEDDISTVEVRKKGSVVFYAERSGGKWVDAAQKEITGVRSWLQGITHLEIERFIDSPSESDRLKTIVAQEPAYEMVFQNIRGQKAKVTVGYHKSQLLGISTLRKESIFQIYFDAIRKFEPPRS